MTRVDSSVVGQVIGTSGTLRHRQWCQGPVSIACLTCIRTSLGVQESDRFVLKALQDELTGRTGEGNDQEKDGDSPTSTQLHASWPHGSEGHSLVQYCFCFLSTYDHPVTYNNLTPNIDVLVL